jgi:hypothetical protein
MEQKGQSLWPVSLAASGGMKGGSSLGSLQGGMGGGGGFGGGGGGSSSEAQGMDAFNAGEFGDDSFSAAAGYTGAGTSAMVFE